MKISDVRRTVQIHTNSGSTYCPTCETSVEVRASGEIAAAINHFLDHGYVLLHVGGEWGRDESGRSITHTTAILGTD